MGLFKRKKKEYSDKDLVKIAEEKQIIIP